MKLLVVGSRGINDVEFVNTEIDKYDDVDTIISGGAVGVDTIAEMWADKNNIPTIIIRPDYKKYFRKAPVLRTIDMIEKADQVLAIWDGKSKGTFHAIRIAKLKNKPLKEVVYEDDLW